MINLELEDKINFSRRVLYTYDAYISDIGGFALVMYLIFSVVGRFISKKLFQMSVLVEMYRTKKSKRKVQRDLQRRQSVRVSKIFAEESFPKAPKAAKKTLPRRNTTAMPNSDQLA